MVLKVKNKQVKSIKIPWKKPIKIYRTNKKIVEELKEPKYELFLTEIAERK